MDEKRNALLTAGIICAIILVFTIADLLNGDRVFSETENRILASRPGFSVEELLGGTFTENYEEYVTDQFISRDKWIGIKTRTDILFQKKDINGVYLGKDNYLIEKHNPEDYSQELVNGRIASLNKLVKKWDAKVMLVPTADNVLTDKLPDYAVYYDQQTLLEQVQEAIGEEHYVDVYSVLREHKDEEIYYRTDHHWTSLGAYYGFLAWTDAVDRYPYRYNIEKMQTASEDFLGTLHSRINIPVEPDRIQYFAETDIRPITVTYDLERTTDTMYEERYLDTKNQYGYFLDDNHAFVEITTAYNKGKTLFVIKDSYANSMIPLLTRYYEKIYVLDLRYYNGKLYDIMEQCEPEEGMDVLVLYNCIHFLEDFLYY